MMDITTPDVIFMENPAHIASSPRKRSEIQTQRQLVVSLRQPSLNLGTVTELLAHLGEPTHENNEDSTQKSGEHDVG